MSWGVIGHVNDGRGSMNFSDWPSGGEEAAILATHPELQVIK